MGDLAKKQGVLSYLCKGSFKTKYKEHYAMLHDASRSGLARLELYQMCKSNPKLVLLVIKKDIVKVMQDESHASSAFTLTTKDQQHCFLARNNRECKKWIEAIQDIFLKPATRVPPPTLCKPQRSAMEKNEIYGMEDSSMAGPATREFVVVVIDQQTQLKLKKSSLRMLVQDRHISLLSMEGQRIVHWAINNIRKMGFTDHYFHLEVGSKSDYGPGYFVFQTSQGRAINTLISQEKEYLKYQMLHSRGTFTHKQTPAVLASALVQPHYSHSPPTASLPPDQASTASSELHSLEHLYDTFEVTTFTDYEESQGACASKGSIAHSIDSLDRHMRSVKQGQAAPYMKNSSQSLEILSSKKNIKLCPTKPMAEDVASDLQGSSECFESDHLYSSVEGIKDAWKTHGCTPDQPMEGEDNHTYDRLEFKWPVENNEHKATTNFRKEAPVAETVYAYVDLAKKNRRSQPTVDN